MTQRQKYKTQWQTRLFSVLAFLLCLFVFPLTAQAACTDPAGEAGEIIFNRDVRAMEYCDGTNWISMGKEASVLHGQKTLGGGYQPSAVSFDGAGDYLTRGGDLTGNADSKMATGSFWYRTNSLGVNQRIISTDGQTFEIVHGTSNQIRFTAFNSSATNILNMGTPSFNNTDWKHVVFSFDLSDVNKRHIYVNGVSNIASASTYVDDAIDFTTTNYAIGAVPLGGAQLNGDIADLWIDIGTYIDLSDPAERAKFYNNGPVYLGANGELPTGSTPEIFLSGDTDDWHTNKGAGGGFTENGALTASTTLPPATAEKKMIGWWKLDEQTGTTAADSSGNGFDGSMQNGLDSATDSIVSPTGRGLDFNGVDARVSVPHQPHLNPTDNNMTIAFWVNPSVDWNDLPNHVWRLIDKSTSDNNTGWHLHVSGYNAENIRLTVGYGSSTSNVQLFGSAWDVNRWYHIAVTVNGDDNSVRMYRDGVLLGTNTGGLTGPIAHNTQPLLIGDGYFNGDLDGYMADVRFYNYPLSAAEIAELYAASDMPYQPNAVAFDGADYLEENALAVSPSPRMTFSTWFRVNDFAARRQIFENLAANVWLYVRSDGHLHFRMEGPGNVPIFGTTLDGTGIGSSTDWHHLLLSVDTASPGRIQAYLDDVEIHNTTGAIVPTDVDIDFGNVMRIGRSLSTGGSDYMNGDMADFWMDIGTYTDLSVEENRRKFISAAGEAVFLGNNGELVTGDPPDIFLSGATDSWHTNKGTGGGFTENGALNDAATKPPGGASIIPRYCSNPVQPAGTLIYNSSENVMQYCDGYRHIPLSSPGLGAGGCVSPSGLAGELVFNTSVNSLQYCDGSGWVGVGDSKLCKLSSWTPHAAAQANEWNGITYGNGTYVAVAGTGTSRVMTSPDGVTWTPRTAAAASRWWSVTYGNGLFVAVAVNGTTRVMTSPDGVTWTPQTIPQLNQWTSVTYGNGTFVAVSYNGTNRVMTSPDGVTWTPQSATEANNWQYVKYANGLFVALASSGTNRVMTSPDGITWTPHAVAANTWSSVAYGNGKFVAVSEAGTNRVMTSTDGMAWTPQSAAEQNEWTSIAFGNGKFVAVSQTGTNRIMTSIDGVNWTAQAAPEANNWFTITNGNGKFVAISQTGTNRVMTASCN